MQAFISLFFVCAVFTFLNLHLNASLCMDVCACFFLFVCFGVLIWLLVLFGRWVLLLH